MQIVSMCRPEAGFGIWIRRSGHIDWLHEPHVLPSIGGHDRRILRFDSMYPKVASRLHQRPSAIVDVVKLVPTFGVIIPSETIPTYVPPVIGGT